VAAGIPEIVCRLLLRVKPKNKVTYALANGDTTAAQIVEIQLK
jgi:hypothetical protein